MRDIVWTREGNAGRGAPAGEARLLFREPRAVLVPGVEVPLCHEGDARSLTK